MVRRSQKPKALNREEASWQEVPSGSKGNGVSGPVLPGFEDDIYIYIIYVYI